jgi:hypothetical protein
MLPPLTGGRSSGVLVIREGAPIVVSIVQPQKEDGQEGGHSGR